MNMGLLGIQQHTFPQDGGRLVCCTLWAEMCEFVGTLFSLKAPFCFSARERLICFLQQIEKGASFVLKQDFNTHDGAAGKNAARTQKQSAPRKTSSRSKKAPKPDDITKAIESLAENRPRSFANTPMNSRNAALFADLAQAERRQEKAPSLGTPQAGKCPVGTLSPGPGRRTFPQTQREDHSFGGIGRDRQKPHRL